MVDLTPGTPADGYTVTFTRKTGTLASNPFLKYTVTAEKFGGLDGLRIVREKIDESDGTTVEQARKIEYVYNDSPGSGVTRRWELTKFGDNNGSLTKVLSKLRLDETDDTPATGDVTEVRSHFEVTNGASTSTVIARDRRVLRAFGNKDKVVEYEMGAAADDLVRKWEYYTADQVAVIEGYADAAAMTAAGEDPELHPVFGKMRHYLSETGYWEHYVYNSETGELERTVSQKGINTYTAPTDPTDPGDPTNSLTLAGKNFTGVVERWDLVDLQRSGYGSANVVARRVFDAGDVVWTGYELNWVSPYVIARDGDGVEDDPATDFNEVWEVNCVIADPAGTTFRSGSETFLTSLTDNFEDYGTFTASGHDHLVTRRFTFREGFSDSGGALNEYYHAGVIYPDGTVTLYDRPTSHERVVKRGEPASTVDFYDLWVRNDFVLENGTITTTYEGPDGETLAVLTEEVDTALNGGDPFDARAVVEAKRDEFGRPLETRVFHGSAASEYGDAVTAYNTDRHDTDITSVLSGETFSTSTQYGCCGVERRTDRYGISTHHMLDDLGRVDSTTSADGSTSTGAEIEHRTKFDGAGRVIEVSRIGTDASVTTVAKHTYDQAGRLTSMEDAEGDKTFYTYRRVDGDGATYTTGDEFYWESRAYPHKASAGPVVVAWHDSRGRVIRSWTGSVATDWNGSEPASIETLSAAFSRSEIDYDGANRVTERRDYFDFGTLTATDLPKLDAPSGAVKDTHYYAYPGGVYDGAGRMVKAEDALGTVSVTVYDAAGRPLETWVGTDVGSVSVPEDYHDPVDMVNSHSANIEQVTLAAYDDLGDLESSRRLKGGLSTLGTFTTDSVQTLYDDDHTVASGASTGRVVWVKPQDSISPWVKQTYDVQGRLHTVETYANVSNTQGSLVGKTENFYDDELGGAPYDDGDILVTGRMLASRVYSVASGAAGDYLETLYTYDDANRRVRTDTSGRGFTLTLFDDHGRVAASLLGADDGGTELDPSDDVVVAETVYGYDDADRVITTSSYSRTPAAPATFDGRLSAAGVGEESYWEATYAATWYDQAGRVIYVADYGDTAP